MNKPARKRTALCPFPAVLLFCAALASTQPAALAQTHGEYFWNTDPGIGKANHMSHSSTGDGGLSLYTIDASGLQRGINILGMRVFSNNRWSHTQFHLVTIPGTQPEGNVTAVEYFWDSDPGTGKGIALPITDIASGDKLFTLPTGALSAGTHILGMRVKAGGIWSQTQTYFVTAPADPAQTRWSMEYFWDNDPGIGHATPIDAVIAPDGGIVEIGLLADGLTPGEHRIGFRTCAGGAWSQTLIASVMVSDDRVTTVIAVEYFWGTDPGYGNGTPVEIAAGQEVAVDNLTIDFPEETADEYVLSFRARSEQGWGTTHTTVIPHLYVENINLTAEADTVAVSSFLPIQAKITPADAFVDALEWNSDTPSIATVDKNGVVEGVSEGEATIRATATDGTGVYAEYGVKVTKQTPLGISGIEAADLSVTTDGNTVIVSGLPAGTAVEVVTTNGMTIYHGTDRRIPIGTPGVYLVKAAGICCKVVI